MEAQNDNQAPNESEPALRKVGLITRLMCKLCGADEERLGLCPQEEHRNIRALGWLMVFVWIYQACLFTFSSHRVFAAPDEIRLELVLASIFLATFILMIDSYGCMRPSWYGQGAHELKNAGLDIFGGSGARIKTSVFLIVRIGILSMGLAEMTAIMFSILFFSKDINEQMQLDFLHTNSRAFSEATALVNADIQRATDAVNAQSARVNELNGQLSLLRQNDIDPLTNDAQIQQAQQEIDRLITEKRTPTRLSSRRRTMPQWRKAA